MELKNVLFILAGEQTKQLIITICEECLKWSFKRIQSNLVSFLGEFVFLCPTACCMQMILFVYRIPFI